MTEAATPRRKLKALVITTEGSERQEYIQELFAHPSMAATFEPPAFSPSVSSRALNNRYEFLRIANEAGLLPSQEWEALQKAHESGIYAKCERNYFDCLKDIPVTTEGRQGSKTDLKLHYSAEFWFKGKTLNRGRSEMACVFAHLIALKRFTAEGFDMILEDNVRAPVETCAKLIWDAAEAGKQLKKSKGVDCNLRFIGWLSSLTNLEYIYNIHSKKRGFPESVDGATEPTIFPLPLLEHVDIDIPTEREENTPKEETSEAKNGDTTDTSSERKHSRPGGNFIWGGYAYWISKTGYELLLDTLRHDVGAMLWKGKRARFYAVKPIDKILPRQIMNLCGPETVHLQTHPSFFRAPMLTSKIHAKWDPEFCKSTEYQLDKTDLKWSDLWLSPIEEKVIDRRKEFGDWLTIGELNKLELG